MEVEGCGGGRVWRDVEVEGCGSGGVWRWRGVEVEGCGGCEYEDWTIDM